MSELPDFSIRNARPRRPKGSKFGAHLLLCLVIVACTAGIFVLYQKLMDQQRMLAEWRDRENVEDPEPRSEIVPPTDEGGGSMLAPSMDQEGEPFRKFDSSALLNPMAEDAEPKEKEVDPVKQETFKHAVGDVRTAMREHDVAGARRYLERARADAQTDEDTAQIERVTAMLDHLRAFWVGVDEAVTNLKAGEEFTVNDAVVVVVEAGEDAIVVRAVGQNRSYPRNDLPHLMLLALGEKWFADSSSSKAILGAYLAVDPKGDPGRARQLWEEAAEAGQDMDLLLPELEYWEGVPRVAMSVAELREKPPSPEMIKDARRKIVDKFSDDYQQAIGMARKAALARKLLEAADKDGEPVTYLAMIYEARELAIGSGGVAMICDTIDVIAEYGQIDPLVEKAECLEKAARYVRGSNPNRELVRRALALFDEALAQGRSKEAKQLADLAAAAAKASKNTSLIRQAEEAAEKIAPPEE